MQLPNPYGTIDPVDLLNWQAQMMAWQAQQDRLAQREQNQAGSAQFDFLTELIKDAQRAQQQAQGANENRYLDLLQLYGVTRGDVLGDLAGFGQSQQADIDRNWDTTRSNLMADLAQRGMPGSTSRIPIEASVNEGRGRQTMALQDMLRERRAGVKERFADKAGGVMERRTDTYPQMSPVAQFSGMLGGMGAAPANRVSPSAFGMGQFSAPPMLSQARPKPAGVGMIPGRNQGTGRPGFPGVPAMDNSYLRGGPFGVPTLSASAPVPASRGRQAQMPTTGRQAFSPTLPGVGQQPTQPRPTMMRPNFNDPANQRPRLDQLYTRNAYSPSPGLGGSPKFTVPAGMGQGQPVTAVPGMIGGPIGLAGSMMPSFPGFGPVDTSYLRPRAPRNYPALRRRRLDRQTAGGVFNIR